MVFFVTASLSYSIYYSDAEETLQISQSYQGSAVHLFRFQGR